MKANAIVFPQLPLNTLRIYTHAVSNTGCKIYIPSTSIERAKVQQNVLQEFLDNQPEPKRIIA